MPPPPPFAALGATLIRGPPHSLAARATHRLAMFIHFISLLLDNPPPPVRHAARPAAPTPAGLPLQKLTLLQGFFYFPFRSLHADEVGTTESQDFPRSLRDRWGETTFHKKSPPFFMEELPSESPEPLTFYHPHPFKGPFLQQMVATMEPF